MQRIVIYGATSAIAQAVARRLVGPDVSFVLVGRDAARTESVAANLRVRGAKAAAAMALDFCAYDSHVPAWNDVKEALGGEVDLVLVAHGLLGDQAAAERDFAHAREILEVGFLSVVSILTPIANDLAAAGHGTIAVIGSVAGDRGRQSNYVYGTSKGALEVFLEGLRNRLFPHGVHVLTVKPGFVDTPMTAHIKKGPLFASADTVARGIISAIRRRKNVVYVPRIWWMIMTIIKSIPEPVFKRLRL